MRAERLDVAVAQPPVVPGDLGANVEEHAAAVRVADARLVVLPELSLTGYDLTAPAVDPDDPALRPLLAACSEAGSVALVGAPVEEDGRASIAMLRVTAAGVDVVYRKCWLHASETERFTAGAEPVVLDVDGWTVGLAICRDTGAHQHTAELARRDVDLYVAGVVDRPEDVAECWARAEVIGRALRAPVAIASCAGPSGNHLETAGHSAVHDATGQLLARCTEQPGEVVTVSLS